MRNLFTFVAFAAAGSLVGLAVGRSVRTNAQSNITTSFQGGVATIRLDVGQSVIGGINDLIGR